MKRNKVVLVFTILLFFMYVNYSNGQGNNTLIRSSKNNQINVLKEYYDKAHGKDSIKYMKLFFVSFPTNFTSFNSIYGYSDKTGPMPLYSLYEKHIAFFCKLNTTQSETDYFSKLIKLGINGHWDADAVNALKHCILNHVNEKPDLTVTLLKKLKDKEVCSFWRFLFDGPHPNNKIVKRQYDTLHKNIELIDKRMANIMQNEYLKLINDRMPQ